MNDPQPARLPPARCRASWLSCALLAPSLALSPLESKSAGGGLRHKNVRSGRRIYKIRAGHVTAPVRCALGWQSRARPGVTGGDPAAPGRPARPGVRSTWPGPLFRTALAQSLAQPQGFRLGGLGVAFLFHLGVHWVHLLTGCSLSRVQGNRWRYTENGASVARLANRLQLGAVVKLIGYICRPQTSENSQQTTAVPARPMGTKKPTRI